MLLFDNTSAAFCPTFAVFLQLRFAELPQAYFNFYSFLSPTSSFFAAERCIGVKIFTAPSADVIVWRNLFLGHLPLTQRAEINNKKLPFIHVSSPGYASDMSSLPKAAIAPYVEDGNPPREVKKKDLLKAESWKCVNFSYQHTASKFLGNQQVLI